MSETMKASEDLVQDPAGEWVSRAHLVFRDLPGYPWLPCPICGGTESCDDTVLERARRAIPGLQLEMKTQ
jgi:hypothetical protein